MIYYHGIRRELKYCGLLSTLDSCSNQWRNAVIDKTLMCRFIVHVSLWNKIKKASLPKTEKSCFTFCEALFFGLGNGANPT
jgi:hypothetical protein